jgi:arsenate reductase
MRITLYHNPQCSKSRQTLTLLQENGVEISIIEYLKEPLTVAELENVARKLDLEPRQFMRHGEPEYQTENLANENLTRQELLEAIVDYPCLLERPIAVTETKAVIGRPPENVLALL